MTPTAIPIPVLGRMAGFRRFTINEYHKLTEIGMLTEDDNLELIEGYLVHKMARNPPHDSCIQLLVDLITLQRPSGYCLRVQSAITLTESEPEPDLVIAKGNARSFTTHHPNPAEIALVIEVSESSLDGDRTDKVRIYSEAGIGCYWIVNLIDRQVEVFEQPSGPTSSPTYAVQTIYTENSAVPLFIGGQHLNSISVADMLP